MKIRNGFVSNSSSSSFTCDVCGNTESGMDIGLSEAGMFECENGHTCCESHQIKNTTITTEGKRKKLISNVEENSYYKTRVREKAVELDEISNYDESEVDDAYDELSQDDGHSAAECPICSFQKLDQGLAIKYLLRRANLTMADLLDELKEKFPTFVEFKKSIIQE